LNWNFGDGATSADTSPVHYYPGPGIYYATLYVVNDSTHCDYLLTKRVKITDVNPNFFASDSNICKGLSTTFSTAVPAPDVLKYYWNFGDDTVKLTRAGTITHTYRNTGIYTVKLTTVDSLNCIDTLTKEMYIKVMGPSALFGVANNGGCINAPVHFLDSSYAATTNPINTWIWNFGDGTSDTTSAPPFIHTYNANGSYWVSLTLTDSRNCTDTFHLPTKVVIKKPSAWFFSNDSVACPGYEVKFACPYAETGITYDWYFGDGSRGTGQSPAHAYLNEGRYTIKLIIRNRYGCEDTSTIVNMIKVRATIASFDMSDSFRTCPPLLIQFTNHSTGVVNSYWNFGDSTSTNTNDPAHFYTYPGIYKASMIAKGPGACADTMTRTIIVKGPKGKISYNPLNLCKPYKVDFTAQTENTASYIWDFNDGVTAMGGDTALSYTYQDSGSFLPKLILVDDIGCRVAVTGTDSIKNVFAKPIFKFSDSILCNGSTVSFQNTSTSNEGITSYQWNFGDSTISNTASASHQYPGPGVYNPSLSITTASGCTGIYQSQVALKVGVAPDINMLASGNGCAPLNATFNAVINPIDSGSVNWYWNLGNNNSSILQNPPPQLFNNAGTYTISVTASISNGCSKTIQKTIEAFAIPVVKIAGNNLLCKGLSVNLSANGGTKYKWFPAASFNCDTCATVIAMPSSSAQYFVTGTSLQGCSSSDSISINVKQPFKITYSKPANICKGQSNRLEANGAATYQWYPAQGLSSTNIAGPTAKPDSSISYRVIGTDDAGCFKDTGFIKLTVYNNPTVNAGPDKIINAGTAVDLEAVYSSDVTDVRWTPSGDVFRAGTNIITVKPANNTEYNVEVKNPGGCYASDRVNVIVKFDGSNVFIPNLFSPNNDGVNDIFYPRGKGIYKIKKMAIFSRWGEMVFEKTNFDSNDPSAGWDGSFKGGKLGTDVFVYVVELMGENGTILPLSGNVSLMR
jgi:gliding motility-associated-like protein